MIFDSRTFDKPYGKTITIAIFTTPFFELLASGVSPSTAFIPPVTVPYIEKILRKYHPPLGAPPRPLPPLPRRGPPPPPLPLPMGICNGLTTGLALAPSTR